MILYILLILKIVSCMFMIVGCTIGLLLIVIIIIFATLTNKFDVFINYNIIFILPIILVTTGVGLFEANAHSIWTGSTTRGSYTKTDCLHPLVLLDSQCSAIGSNVSYNWLDYQWNTL